MSARWSVSVVHSAASRLWRTFTSSAYKHIFAYVHISYMYTNIYTDTSPCLSLFLSLPVSTCSSSASIKAAAPFLAARSPTGQEVDILESQQCIDLTQPIQQQADFGEFLGRALFCSPAGRGVKIFKSQLAGIFAK